MGISRLAKWLAPPLLIAIGVWALFVGDRAPGTDAARRGFPLDDAWIHLVYARSLAQEGGFHYNRGAPEAGMTSPLWVVLTSGVVALAGAGNTPAVVMGVKALSLGAGLAAIMMLFLIAMELGAGALTAFLAAMMMALDPAQAFARASGMEVPLFTALFLAATWAALRGRILTCGVLAGLAVVARPEAVVLLPVEALLLVMSRRRGGQEAPSRAGLVKAERVRGRTRGAAAVDGRAPRGVLRWGVAVLLALLPAAAYAAFCQRVTGHPLPNTFYVKFTSTGQTNWAALAFGWKNYVHDDLPWFTLEVGSLLAILGVVRAWRRHGARGLLTLAAGALLFCAVAMTRELALGHHFYWERWVVPSHPPLMLAIALGVAELLDGLPSFSGSRGSRATPGRPRPSPAWIAVAVAVGALLVARAPAALATRADQYAWNVQNIEELNVAGGHWIAAHTPPDAVVGVTDAGAIRYFGNRTTVDLFGLNDHRVLNRDVATGSNPFEAFGIQYLAIDPLRFPELGHQLPLTVLNLIKSPHYTVSDAAQSVMVFCRIEWGKQP